MAERLEILVERKVVGVAAMTANFGFRILPRPFLPDDELLAQYRDVATPHISDHVHRMYACSTGLRPYHRAGKLVGAALTVKTRPGDNLLIHKAIDLAVPGEVIVVEAGGDTTNSLVGEIMLRLAQKNRIAGFVIDGAIRDSAAFRDDAFPVYARGATHRGPYKDGPGEINVPVSVGGMIVRPGDIVVGDEDGLIAMSPDLARSLLPRIRQLQHQEKELLKSIENGTVDRSWVDRLLKQRGCE